MGGNYPPPIPHSPFPTPHSQLISGSRRRRAANQDFGPGLEFQLSSALDVYRAGSDGRAENRADGRAFTAAGNPSDDRAERPAADGACGGVLSPAAGFDVAFFVHGLDGLALVDLLDLTGKPATTTVAQSDRIERQRELGFTRGLAGFIKRGDMAFDDRFRIIARIEHDGGELVAFPVRLRADLSIKADLHFDSVRNDGAPGGFVIRIHIGVARAGRRGIRVRGSGFRLRRSAVSVDHGDHHSAQIRRDGGRERPPEESVVVSELKTGAVGLLKFRSGSHPGLVPAVSAVESVAARKIARLALVEIALAFREAVFITEAVSVLIGVAISGRAVGYDLRTWLRCLLRGLRRRADERSQQGHIQSKPERHKCHCLANKACVHKLPPSVVDLTAQLMVRGPRGRLNFYTIARFNTSCYLMYAYGGSRNARLFAASMRGI